MASRLILAGLLVIGGAGAARAQAADEHACTAPPPQEARAAPPIEAAPGGGEMVVLGPESRYVTRAWRDAAGRVHGACGHEPAVSAAAREGGQR